MIFEKGYLYHIFNQGNNKRKTFFNRENYIFFLRKINTYITPYADILSWCLMPNHFHLMVYVREVEIPLISQGLTLLSQGLTSSETLTKEGKPMTKKRSFNDSIGIMLRTYTRAINKQEKLSGSLFRKKTKAECINCPDGITPSFITKNSITELKVNQPEKEYPQVCFDYIHLNPTEAKLVNNTTDWEFSSAKDYAGLRNGKLVNKKLAQKYVQF